MGKLARFKIMTLFVALLTGLALAGPVGSANAALPRNGKIAFVRANQIYLANANGTGVKKITAGAKNYAPAFSRDGKKIAYIHEVSGRRNLWIMNANGTGKRQITKTGGVTRPAWSPDGKWLAYSGGGTLRRVMTTAPYIAQQIPGSVCGSASEPVVSIGNVAWSPSGRYIAYYTTQWCDSPDYYLNYVDLTTGDVESIDGVGGACCGEGYFENPTFSSDSRLLAYDFVRDEYPESGPLSSSPPQIDIRVFPGTSHVPYLAHLYDKQPVFAPNNAYLLFTNDATGVAQIWRSGLNGANRKKITTGYQPTWQPLP